MRRPLLALFLTSRRERSKTNRAVLKLTITTLMILVSLATTTHTSLALNDPIVSIDVFTQKATYNGNGFNQPSDMFGPAEMVILYAVVMIDNTPAYSRLVTFEITGPRHMPEDQKLYQTAETNASGIAETQFSLAVTNQSDAFGTWIVTAKTEIGGETYSDLLWFQVNRVVELGLIRTLNNDLLDQTVFGIGGYVGFEITLRNNARTPKTTKLTITVLDELEVAVATMEIDSFTVPPAEKTLHLFNKLYIPKFTFPGRATLIVNALDEHGTAYCPKSSTIFLITVYDPLAPNFTDASVYLNPLPTKTEEGNPITIVWTVRNEGTVTLNDFNTSIHVDNTLLTSQHVNSIEPYAFQTFQTVWITSNLQGGNHIVTASVQTLPNEADLSDNTYTSQVELGSARAQDVAITSLTATPTTAEVNSPITITATIKNLGDEPETFNVKFYANTSEIRIKTITQLQPNLSTTLSFAWDTSNLHTGNYTIWALADYLPEETNKTNNMLTDGTVTLLEPSIGPPTSSFNWAALIPAFAIALLIALVLLLMLYYLKRRGKKKPPKSGYVIISHTHI